VTGGASGVGLVVSTFLASAVEFVEAFTIVLAMGLTRGWRSALWGVAAAVMIIATLPPLLLGLFMYGQIGRSMTAGALKG